jgi:hypothetical protein
MPESPSGETSVARDPASVEIDVLAEIEHALGNLLQRLHHTARSIASPHGEQLEEAVGDLERLLALVFDYVSPTPVQVRPVAVATAVESLCAQLRGLGASVTLGAVCAGTVRVDPRILNRSWQLLGEACVVARRGPGEWYVEAERPAASDQVECRLHAVTGGAPEATDPRATLAAAVARRLLALQGGALRHRVSDDTAYAVVLPAGES